ncbi:MAG: lipopolysaccharide kinase InaA family protein [Planctomycetales bacterium]
MSASSVVRFAHDRGQEPRGASAPRSVRRCAWNRRLEHAPDVPDNLLDTLWSDPDALLDESALIKDGGRCTVLKFERGGRPWILKRYNLRGPLHTAAHFCLESRARRNWVFGHRLLAAGVLTPPPMACLEHCLGPLRTRSFLLSPFANGTELRRALQSAAPPADLDELAREFERLWRKLGELRLSHGDMKTTNFLVTPERRLMLIDLDGMRHHRRDGSLRRARARDRARFLRDWEHSPIIAAAFRRRIERKEAA